MDRSFGWFLLELRTSASAGALASLRKAGYECFAPMTIDEGLRGKGRRSRVVPLFPGYVFFRQVAMSPQFARRHPTLCRGVLRLITRADGRPIEVPAVVMRHLLRRSDASGAIELHIDTPRDQIKEEEEGDLLAKPLTASEVATLMALAIDGGEADGGVISTGDRNRFLLRSLGLNEDGSASQTPLDAAGA